CNDETVPIVRTVLRQFVKIPGVLDRHTLFLRTIRSLYMNAQFCFYAVLVVDFFSSHKSSIHPTRCRYTGNDYLLYKLQLERTDRVKPVNQVIRIAMCSGVTQRTNRIQCLD